MSMASSEPPSSAPPTDGIVISGDSDTFSFKRATRANKSRPSNIDTSRSRYMLLADHDKNYDAFAGGLSSGVSKQLGMQFPYTPTSPSGNVSPSKTGLIQNQSTIQNFLACQSPRCSLNSFSLFPNSPTSPNPAQFSYNPLQFAPIRSPQFALNPYLPHPGSDHPSFSRSPNGEDGRPSMISFEDNSDGRSPSQLPSPISPQEHARLSFSPCSRPMRHGPYNLFIPSFEQLQKRREDWKRKDTSHMPQQNVQGKLPVFHSKPGSRLGKSSYHDGGNRDYLEEKATVSAKYLANHMLNAEFARRYVIGDELGSGGFGFVTSAERTLDGREVAVKFIHKDKVPVHGWIHDARLGYIPMEIYVIKNFTHPGMIAYLDMYEDIKFFYLVMELHGTPWTASNSLLQSGAIPPTAAESVMFPSTRGGGLVGTTSEVTCVTDHPVLKKLLKNPPPPGIARRTSCDLFECIEHHSKFSESTARHIFKQIVNCVRFLNECGICHRDIKDENIVIDKNFQVKLIDFGSAVIVRPTGRLFDRFYGTINYASPEILRGEKYRAESAEIWSLGILLYTLLYGEVPFNDPHQAIYGPYVTPKIQSSHECIHLLNWMLEKKGNQRASIEEVSCHPWLHAAPNGKQ